MDANGNEWLAQDHPVQPVGLGIWFGEHLIRSWEATPDRAAAYTTFVRRHLRGLTVKPLPADEPTEPLPEPDWWLLVSR